MKALEPKFKWIGPKLCEDVLKYTSDHVWWNEQNCVKGEIFLQRCRQIRFEITDIIPDWSLQRIKIRSQ